MLGTWFHEPDLTNVLLGGVVGYVLVSVVDYVRRPRLKGIGLERSKGFPYGELVRLHFKVAGGRDPGVAYLKLAYHHNGTTGSAYAKWDDTPEPVVADAFHPELIPATYYQQLFLGDAYSIPVAIIEEDEQLGTVTRMFSGWWYGLRPGAVADNAVSVRPLHEDGMLTLSLGAASMRPWKKEYRVRDLLEPVSDPGGL